MKRSHRSLVLGIGVFAAVALLCAGSYAEDQVTWTVEGHKTAADGSSSQPVSYQFRDEKQARDYFARLQAAGWTASIGFQRDPNPTADQSAPQGNSPAGNTGTGSDVTTTERDQIMDLHNQERQAVGVGALTWNNDLAQAAQQFADSLATSGKWEHSDTKDGENMAAGYASDGSYTVLSGVKAWYAEKTNFDTKNGGSTGHYTQMIWKTTTQIGVGKAIYTTGNMKGQLVIVGRYNPPGNWTGEDPLNPQH